MNKKKLASKAVACSLAAFCASAEAGVVDYADVAGYTTFQDTNTGYVWLDLNNFYNEASTEGTSGYDMIAAAEAAGFTFATRSDVEQLLNTLPLTSGVWSSYAAVMGYGIPRQLIWGMYDDGDGNPYGYAWAYSANTSWHYSDNATNADSIPNYGNPGDVDMGIWAYLTRLLELDAVLTTSLGSTSAIAQSNLAGSGLVLHGSHSRPLSYRVDPGSRTFWASGDWGRDSHSDRDGDTGLGEVGLGYNYGGVQLNVALGRTWGNQDLALNGDLDTDGTYLFVEAMKPLAGSLWGVLAGYYHWGDADIRRGYLSGQAPDFSNGGTDTRTWAIRARLEWDALAQAGGMSFNPYGELSYAHTRMDAYTETGGDYPVAFDSREESATELRLGVLGALPLRGSTLLLAQLEGVHRFEEDGARVSGEVIGQFGFDLDARGYEQDWLRAGVGLESPLGGGKASLMLNATTEGEEPDLWLAARYQMAF
jgi:hypothetical protein